HDDQAADLQLVAVPGGLHQLRHVQPVPSSRSWLCCSWFRPFSVWMSSLVSVRCAGVLMSGKCFCPSRTPKRIEKYEGLGTPLPKRAVNPPLLVATAAPVLGVDGASCWKLSHRVEP